MEGRRGGVGEVEEGVGGEGIKVGGGGGEEGRGTGDVGVRDKTSEVDECVKG